MERIFEIYLYRDVSYIFDVFYVVYECDNYRYINDKIMGKYFKNVYVWFYFLVNYSDLFKCVVIEIYQLVYYILRL